METPNNINETLADIYTSINQMSEKITRIFTTLAGDNELLGRGIIHRIDDIEKNVDELRQFKTKVTAIAISSATIGSVIGSVISQILK
jgi:uncharacterized protein Yka (UPF0111/DUF47 family)